MDSIGSIIKKIGNNLETYKNQSLKSYGLTSAQFEVLFFLFHKKECKVSQKDISIYLGVKHTSTINIMKILEAKEFIWKEVDSENAKYRNVHLTQKGKETICNSMQNRLMVDQVFFKEMTIEEQQILLNLLKKGYNNLLKEEWKEKRI